MKTAARLRRAMGNPRLFVRGVNRLYHRWGGLRSENGEGVDVFDEDWDTLILLDACRYDLFEQCNSLEGRLSSKLSKGSATAEWLRAQVHGKDLRDTVYVTANPQLERNRENWDINLHETINVWLDDGWDEQTGTVLAETMTEAAIEAYERHPHKRLLVHYMQPHYPFVPSATEFDNDHLRTIESGDDAPVGENVWNQKFAGTLNVSRDALWEMYAENLVYVLEHVAELRSAIPGKTVITSDHGNYVGERATPIPIREYGHPRGLYDDVLVRVPWLEYTNGERREITAGSVESGRRNGDSDIVTERLRALGYSE